MESESRIGRQKKADKFLKVAGGLVMAAAAPFFVSSSADIATKEIAVRQAYYLHASDELIAEIQKGENEDMAVFVISLGAEVLGFAALSSKLTKFIK